MHEKLFQTFAKLSKSKSFRLTRGDQRPEIWKVKNKEITNNAVSLKSEVHDDSVSNIMLRTNNEQVNLNAIEINNHLADFCKKMNFPDFALIVNSKPVKAQHLNNSRFHLNKKGPQVLIDVNCKEIVKIFK